MSRPDLNLLVTLDVLLAEGSVAGAARRLHLSPSAMSRALARLRDATGDPLLVKAGRGLVPSPRALALRDRVGQVVLDAEAMLRPADALDLARLRRTFTFRARDGFVENFGAALIARVADEAPGVRLRFLPKQDKETGPLRAGEVDLETGVVGRATGLELRAQSLFSDRFVGVVAPGHPFAASAPDGAAFAAARHVAVSTGGRTRGPVDEALARVLLQRDVVATVGGFSAALALVRASCLVATVPERHTACLRQGLHAFPLPVAVDPMTVSLLWHPRWDGDAAHRWFRGVVRAACTPAPTEPVTPILPRHPG